MTVCEDQHQSLVDGLKAAVPMLEASGITLVIEPLNERVDHAGYYLIRSDEAFEIIEEVASPQIKVVFDIYHQQISEGHLIHNITSNIDKIGHFHAAGNPGRHELSLGEIHSPSIPSPGMITCRGIVVGSPGKGRGGDDYRPQEGADCDVSSFTDGTIPACCLSSMAALKWCWEL